MYQYLKAAETKYGTDTQQQQNQILFFVGLVGLGEWEGGGGEIKLIFSCT